jgi:signal transduction histidine kinase
MAIGFALRVAGPGLAGFVLLVMAGAAGWRATVQLAEEAARARRTQAVLQALAGLVALVNDAATAERGYVITGTEAYLEPFERALTEVGPRLTSLEGLLDDDGHDRTWLDRLRGLVDERLSLGRRIVQLRRIEGEDGVRASRLMDEARTAHDAIRALALEVERGELGRLQAREAAAARAARAALGLIGAATLVAAIVVSVAVAGLLRHLHARRQAEARLVAANAELRAATEQARAADRVKSAFLATMSHELRTPLNSIIGFTSLLLQELPGPVNAEQRKQLEIVRASARHLLALINDVLDISRIEAGALEVDAAPFDADAVVGRVVEVVRPLAAAKGLALGVEIPHPLGRLVSDQRRVEQILLNLLGNAVKFTDAGEIVLAAEADGDGIRFAVRDTGVGIEAADLASIFEPFRQVDARLSRRHEGTGLGLAISYRIAQKLGGRIEVASRRGTGSTFTLALPREPPGVA